MRFFSTTFSVFRHSFREQYKNKFFSLIVVFAVIVIYVSLLAGIMAVDQEARVLTDFGLGLMELITLAYAVFSGAVIVSGELEKKTIYLIFSRPVSKPAYLAGRLAGLFASAGVLLAIMSLFHLGLLYFRGCGYPRFYAVAVLFVWFKLIVISATALFISLFSTSMVSTTVISFILWTLGHFLGEARFLVERSSGAAAVFLKPVMYLIPDMQVFNFRDAFGAGAGFPFSFALCYMILWVAVAYSFSCLLFRKKEF